MRELLWEGRIPSPGLHLVAGEPGRDTVEDWLSVVSASARVVVMSPSPGSLLKRLRRLGADLSAFAVPGEQGTKPGRGQHLPKDLPNVIDAVRSWGAPVVYVELYSHTFSSHDYRRRQSSERINEIALGTGCAVVGVVPITSDLDAGLCAPAESVQLPG